MEFRRLVALALSVACATGAGPGFGASALAAAAGAPQQRSALAVSGTVVESNRMTPVANMLVRLRNLGNGMIAGMAVSGANGAFSFDLPAPGLYMVEALKGGGVAAVGDPVTVAGSAVTTTVTLPSQQAGTATAAASGYSILLPIAATVGVVGLIVGLYKTSPER